MDTATFDNIFIPSANTYNFMVGKIRVISSSIFDPAPPVEVSVYPNPAGDYFILKNVEAGTEVVLYDITGRNVMQLLTSGGDQMIDIRSLNNGTYFVRMKNGKREMMSGRLVKTN